VGRFFDVVSLVEARKLEASGRVPYEYKTKNVAQGPIFGPAYDDQMWVERAKQENRFAETIEQAQQCAKAVGTEIGDVIFLVGK